MIPLSAQSVESNGGLSTELKVGITIAVVLLAIIVVSVVVVVVCVKKRRKAASDRSRSQKAVVTTNQIYRCEEFEDAGSVYDNIEEEDHYDELNEKAVYLDVLSDETEESNQGSEPELPSPRPVTTSHDQNQHHEYQSLNTNDPDHVHRHEPNDETVE